MNKGQELKSLGGVSRHLNEATVSMESGKNGTICYLKSLRRKMGVNAYSSYSFGLSWASGNLVSGSGSFKTLQLWSILLGKWTYIFACNLMVHRPPEEVKGPLS